MPPGEPPTLSSWGAGAKGRGLSPPLAAGSQVEGKAEDDGIGYVLHHCHFALLPLLRLLCSGLLAKLKAPLSGQVE